MEMMRRSLAISCIPWTRSLLWYVMTTMGVAVMAALLSWPIDTISARRRLPSSTILQLDDSVVRETSEEVRYLKDQEREWAKRSDSTPNGGEGGSDKAEDYLVQDLPGLNASTFHTKHYAGLINIDKENDGNIFYWLFEAQEDPDKAPLLIWLNGGPGCSSMDGLFLELGPFRLDEKGEKIKINPMSWHKKANLLFVDQPFGTGFAYVSNGAYPKTGTKVAEQFYDFIVAFLRRHKTFLTEDQSDPSNFVSRDIFLFGESYAGRYIPQFTELAIKRNTISSRKEPRIVIQGAGLGNAWIHPYIQYDYSDYAHGVGLISYGQVRSLKGDYELCRKQLDEGEYHAEICLNNLDSILESVSGGGLKLNFYDVTQYLISMDDFPLGHDIVERYLNRKDVRKAIHATSSPKFLECADPIYLALEHEDGLSTMREVDFMLTNGVRVLFYNGQWDLMCNHVATEQLLLQLKWPHSQEFLKATKYTWVSGPQPLGYVKSGGGLTYVMVIGAGHMVPMNAPAASLDMVDRFIESAEYSDRRQKVETLSTSMSDVFHLYCNLKDIASPNNPTFTWLLICLLTAVVCIMVGSVGTKRYYHRISSTQDQHEMVRESAIDESDSEADNPDEALIETKVVINQS